MPLAERVDVLVCHKDLGAKVYEQTGNSNVLGLALWKWDAHDLVRIHHVFHSDAINLDTIEMYRQKIILLLSLVNKMRTADLHWKLSGILRRVNWLQGVECHCDKERVFKTLAGLRVVLVRTGNDALVLFDFLKLTPQ